MTTEEIIKLQKLVIADIITSVAIGIWLLFMITWVIWAFGKSKN